MQDPWLDRYIEAWALHPKAGTPEGAAELKALQGFFSDTARYEDVPTASVFEGHDGIRRMCELAHQWSSDLEFNVISRLTNGELFAFECETRGTNDTAMGGLPATGLKFVLRGVSVGILDPTGLVREQRDYWDLGSFLAQIGVLPAST